MYYLRISDTKHVDDDDANKNKEVSEQNTNVDLIQYCRNCGNEEKSENKGNILISKKTKKKDVTLHHFINEYTKLDPTIPRINYIDCIEKDCPSNIDDPKTRKEKDILYIKYDREKLKYLYMCCHCDTIWDNNMQKINVQ